MPTHASSSADPASSRLEVPDPGTPLAQRLAATMRASGPMSFAMFMQRALYEPGLGYYRRDRPAVGREGDFLTSPEVDPVFGYAVGAVAASVWESLGRPPTFDLVDVGPGTGALVEQVWRWATHYEPALASALRVILVEASPAAAARQRARLEQLGGQARWSAELPARGAVRGVVVGNELLDAQPVHRLRWDAAGGAWREIGVDLDDDGRFVEVEGSAEATLCAPLAGCAPSAGQVVEVSPAVPELVERLSDAVSAGALLLFDYGYPRAELYASWRRTGTLMTFHRHVPGEDPYIRVGEQDLTCHVDVDAAREAAAAGGLHACAVRPQSEWLVAMGALASAAAARAAGGDEALARRRGVQALVDPDGLGRIRVMAFTRGELLLPGLEPA